jgi:type I restriction enzyme, S subunit
MTSEVPDRWMEVSLDQLGLLSSGSTPSRSQINSTARGEPYIAGPGQWTPNGLIVDRWTTARRAIVPDGSIFIVVKGGGVGKVFPGLRSVIGRDLVAFVAYAPLNHEFMLVTLEVLCSALADTAKGQVLGLTRQEILDLTVALPPLAEQGRIVTQIREARELLEGTLAQLEVARGEADSLRDRLFLDAFTGELTRDWRSQNSSEAEDLDEPHDDSAATAVTMGSYGLALGRPSSPTPTGWRWVRLADVAQLRTGHTPSRRVPEYWNGNIPWMAIADAGQNDGKIITDTAQHISESGVENSAAEVLPVGTICWARTGSFAYVVTSGVPLTTSQHFFNWTCGPALDAQWLRWLLIAERRVIDIFGRGTSHKTIYFDDAARLHVLLPPSDEQAEVARRITERMAAISRLVRELDDADQAAREFEQQTCNAALKGRLDTGDSNDEPAFVLLAHLETEINLPRNEIPETDETSADFSGPNSVRLVATVREDPEGISPEQLFGAAGYRSDGVDTFFRDLSDAVNSGAVRYVPATDRIVAQ